MKIIPHISKAERMYEFLIKKDYNKIVFERAFYKRTGLDIKIDLYNKKEALELIKTFQNTPHPY